MTTRVLPSPGGTPREVAVAVNNLLNGKVNSVGTVSVTAGTSTALTDRRIGPDSVVLLMPGNSEAASLMTSLYVDNLDTGTCTINHSAPGGSAAFSYVVLG